MNDTGARTEDVEERLLIDPREAAKRLSLGRTTVYELLQRGELESISVGRARRIPMDAIEEWLRAKRAAA